MDQQLLYQIASIPFSSTPGFDAIDPPPGENPYDFYRRILHTHFNPVPTEGFLVRICVLSGLLAYLLFNGVAILIVSFLDSRRGRKDFWLWRRVERAEGNYWTGNEPVLYALGQVITVLSLGAYVWVGWARFTEVISSRVTLFVFVLAWYPALLQSLFICYANFHAYLFSIDGGPKNALVRPLLVNLGYWSSPVVGLVGLGVVGCMTGIRWVRFVDNEETVENLLRVLASAGARGSENDLGMLMDTMSQLRDEVGRSLKRHSSFDMAFRASWGLCIFFGVAVTIFNITGFVLAFSVRRHVKQASTIKGGGTSMISSTATASTFNSMKKTESSSSLTGGPRCVRGDSFSSYVNGNPHCKELKRVSTEVLTLVMFIQGIVFVFAGNLIYIIVLGNGTILRSWQRTEIAVFLPVWIYAVPSCVASSYLLYRKVCRLCPPIKRPSDNSFGPASQPGLARIDDSNLGATYADLAQSEKNGGNLGGGGPRIRDSSWRPDSWHRDSWLLSPVMKAGEKVLHDTEEEDRVEHVV